MSPALFVLGLSVLLAPPLEISATPSTRLYVRTMPPGAVVTVDGRSVGTSDGLFLMPPGVTKLTVELDGHQGETRQVEITEGRITRVEIELKKRPAAPGGTVKGNQPGTRIEFPRIVATSPAVGATEVDPATSEITVTFDRDMGKGYSWTGDGPYYPPASAGQKAFWRDARTCVLPVTIEAGRYYRVGIQSSSHENFRSADGVPARPSAIYFTTLGAPEEVKRLLRTPRIVSFFPPQGAKDVDPALSEIRVTFDMPMGKGSSWIQPGGKQAYWTEDRKTYVLPVRLKPGENYPLGLVGATFNNFQSEGGVPVEPVVYTFTTRVQQGTTKPAKGAVTWTKILVNYPGATTTTMDETVAAPLERALIDLPEIGTVVCSSAAAQTEVFVEGKPGISDEVLQAAVHKALAKAQEQLPAQAKVATVGFYEGQIPPPRVDVIVDPRVVINREMMARMGVAPDDVQKAIRKAKESGQKLTEVVVENQRGLKVRLTNIAHIMAPQEPAYRVRRWPPEKAAEKPAERVEDVARRFFAALRDKDLQRMKDLSLGSVEGWAVGPPSRRSFPGLHEQLLQVLIKEAPKELDLASLNEVKGTATCGPFAAVRFAGPAHMPKDRYLMAVFKNTPQGWRFVSLQDEIGPLEGALVNCLARWEKKRAEAVATEFLTALRDKDLPKMKSLSLGSVLGWTSTEQAGTLPRAAKLPGLSESRMEKMVKEIRDEVFARRPELLAQIQEAAVQNDFAAVWIPGPALRITGPTQYLIVIFRKTSQSWRFVQMDDGRAPLKDELARHVKLLSPILAEIEAGASAQYVFGPVMERTVQDDRTNKDWMLDLDTGVLDTPPAISDTPHKSEQMLQWARQKGIDISGVKAGQGILHGVDLQIVVLDDTSWDQVTAELLKTALKGHESGGITPQLQKNVQKALEPGGGDRNGVSTIRQLRMTIGGGSEPQSALYGFKTREGGMGVLRIGDVADNPAGTKIRYRLVVKKSKDSEEKPASITAAATKLAESWFRAITAAKLDESLVLSDVPFSWDRKELIKTTAELKSRCEQVFAKKGARDLKPSQVSLLAPSEAKEHLKTVWLGDPADTNILVVQITLGTEHVDVLVRPGKEFKVVGFSD